MIHRIVVGLDKSALGEQVLQRAIRVARCCGAELKLVHSLVDSEPEAPEHIFHMGGHYYPTIDQALMEAYQRDWNDYVARSQTWLDQQLATVAEFGLKASCELTYGAPGTQLCQIANAWQADLLIVGSRGRTGLSQLLLGSVSNYVTHHARCSVLVVSDQDTAPLATTQTGTGQSSEGEGRQLSQSKARPQRILVPVDRSDASLQAISDAVALAKVYDSEVKLLHVLVDGEPGSPDSPIYDGSYYVASNAMTEQYHHAWNKFVNNWWIYLRMQAVDAQFEGISVSYDVMQGQAGPQICQAAKDWNADLIMIGSRGLSELREVFLGSTSQYVSHRAPCSVWITYPQRQESRSAAAAAEVRQSMGVV